MTDNLLRFETSPYLLQHKDNPVHWRAWGAPALAEAVTTDRPILLSVGYAACHWCHVMAHESFEDAETAALMNALFVNIKVDREGRPDIDQLYMAALTALGEQGGWPLTMFLTPSGKPIWGGTYFPKTSRYGRPGFQDVLRQIETLYRTELTSLQAQADRITAHIATRPSLAGPEDLHPDLLDQAVEAILGIMDPVLGGTRGAPKFPNVPVLDFLAGSAERTGRPDIGRVVEATLLGLANGGIFDHVGGGFARYSTDARWLVPHFEKMLYDNGLLVEQMALASVASPHAELFRDRIESSIDWLLRELRLPAGGFAAGLDADSEGEEGRFYVWRRDELDDVPGEADAAFIARLYDITAEGNWEGSAIANRLAPGMALTAEDDLRRRHCLAVMLSYRDRRPRPALDDQVLADWNGLAVSGLATAGLLLGRPDWIAKGISAFAFISGAGSEDGRPAHVWCRGRRGVKGFSTDLASLARASIALNQATGDGAWLNEADRLLDLLARHHGDGAGGFHLAPDDGDSLIIRKSERFDEATPNAHGMAAEAHIKLWALRGAEHHRAAADLILAAAARTIRGNVFGTASLLAALDLRLRVTSVVIIVPEGGDASALKSAVVGHWRRHLVLDIRRADAALPASHPASGKGAVGDQPTAYVCHEGRCSLPVTEPAELVGLIVGDQT